MRLKQEINRSPAAYNKDAEMVVGIFVPADTEEFLEVHEFELLEKYQVAVGGLIEAVDIQPLGVTAYVNDEGLTRHSPFNSRSTFLWCTYVPHTRNQATLVGNALLVGLPDHDGASTDVAAPLVERLTTLEKFAILMNLAVDESRVAAKTAVTSRVLLSLVMGDPNWFIGRAEHQDIFSATVWAMVLEKRWPGAMETLLFPKPSSNPWVVVQNSVSPDDGRSSLSA